MIRLLYNIAWPIGLIFFLPGYIIKMIRRGGYRKNFGQRLGFYSDAAWNGLRGVRPTWIHAVSVGEVGIALKLANELRALQPELRCLLTTTTTTGYGLAERLAPPWINTLYAPLDFWPVMRRAFRMIDPNRIILIEAEVWPNLVTEASRRRIPVILANARLSPRSEARFRRFKWMVAPFFQKLDLVCVSTAEEAARWRSLGIPLERIRVVGSIKYDPQEQRTASSEPRQVLEKLGIDPSRPIVFGGSTHRGEEEAVVDAFSCLRQQFPSLFLIIAPRHVERVPEVEQRLRRRGLRIVRRSSCSDAPADVDGLLLDTTGELRDWYCVATVVFIGKSLTAHGGQNPVEAINAGKPVVFGPHMENFARIAEELVESGAALRIQTSQQLIEEWRRLLSNHVLRQEIATAARRVIRPHYGATLRTAQLIEKTSRDGAES
jgi:3-deoxy-D-manno-octulosonic-acid transferase